MQTCVGATAGLAFTGGFGSYLIAMDQQSYLNLGSTVGNYASVRAPSNPPRTYICSLSLSFTSHT